MGIYRDCRLVVSVRREGEGAVREGEQGASVGHCMKVQVILSHDHGHCNRVRGDSPECESECVGVRIPVESPPNDVFSTVWSLVFGFWHLCTIQRGRSGLRSQVSGQLSFASRPVSFHAAGNATPAPMILMMSQTTKGTKPAARAAPIVLMLATEYMSHGTPNR